MHHDEHIESALPLALLIFATYEHRNCIQKIVSFQNLAHTFHILNTFPGWERVNDSGCYRRHRHMRFFLQNTSATHKWNGSKNTRTPNNEDATKMHEIKWSEKRLNINVEMDFPLIEIWCWRGGQRTTPTTPNQIWNSYKVFKVNEPLIRFSVTVCSKFPYRLCIEYFVTVLNAFIPAINSSLPVSLACFFPSTHREI